MQPSTYGCGLKWEGAAVTGGDIAVSSSRMEVEAELSRRCEKEYLPETARDVTILTDALYRPPFMEPLKGASEPSGLHGMA